MEKLSNFYAIKYEFSTGKREFLYAVVLAHSPKRARSLLLEALAEEYPTKPIILDTNITRGTIPKRGKEEVIFKNVA